MYICISYELNIMQITFPKECSRKSSYILRRYIYIMYLDKGETVFN